MKNNLIDHLQASGESRTREGYFYNKPFLSSLRLLAVLLLCCLYLQSWAKDGNFGGGDGSSSNPYLIEDAADLGAFRDKVNGGNAGICAKLTANIDLSSVCSASSGTSWNIIWNSYTGTFDGNHFSITGLYINTRHGDYCGFFALNGGTIKDLTLQGDIYIASAMYVGGIAGGNNGTISGCTYIGSVKGDNGVGSFVGVSWIGTITNCFSSATLSGSNIGGIICDLRNGYVKNSLFTGSTSSTNYCGIAYSGKGTSYGISNCYFLNGSDSHATQVTSAQLKSGEVAYLLQGSQGGQVWGENIGTDTVPTLTNMLTSKVCRLTYTNGSTTVQTAYTNYGKTLGMPDPALLKQVYGTAYDSTRFYTWSVDSLVNQPVKQDLTLTPSSAEYCDIHSPETFTTFAASVNAGNVYTTGKLTKNIDFSTWSPSNAWTMISNFAGTLDGQGYTVSNFNKGRDLWNQQPFFSSIAAGGTVKNFTFSLCSASVLGSSALIAQTNNGTVQNVTLLGAWIQGRDNNTAGIASNNGGTITDCAVLQSTFKKRWSGVNNKTEAAICGYSNANGVISNCLSIQNNYVEPGLGDATEGSSAIVVRNSGKVTNCFTDTYLHKDSLMNLATLVTNDQLKSGYVAHALQNGRSAAVWGQILSTDTVPSLTTNAAAQVYTIAYKRVTPIETIDYSNGYVNGQSSLNLPTAQQLAGDSYSSLIDITMAYKATYANGTTKEVTSESKADGDMTVSCMLTPTAIKLSGEGTADSPYLISTAEELAAFSGWVNLKTTSPCGKIMKDIDFASYSKAWDMMFNFAGTLNGDGHTLLNFNQSNINIWNPLTQNVVKSGVIKNLKFNNARVIIQGNDGSAIVVRRNDGTVQGVSVANSLVQCGNFNNLAAIVSYNTGLITDCSVTGTTIQHIWGGANTKTLAGICGKSSGTISNCYVANNTYSNGVSGSSSFVVTNIGTVTNCYTDALVLPKDSTTKTATLLNVEQMKSGYLTHALQAGRTDAVWGQKLATDVLPQLTSLDSAQVYSVKYLMGSTAFDSLYVNRYDTLALPTTGQIVGSIYNKLITYNTTFTNSDSTAVNPSTPVTADMQITCAATANGLKMNGTGTTEEPYLISTAEELAAFRDYVNLGNTAICGKLTQDIDLSTVCGEKIGSWEPISSNYKIRYNGTFNGNKHNIKSLFIKNENPGKYDLFGLFGWIDRAGIIERLHTDGNIEINSSSTANQTGGIAGISYGIINTCSFSGKISDSGKTNQEYGGIAGLVHQGGQIINCWSDAEISGHEGVGGIAGFVSNYTNPDTEITDTSKITNCLFTGKVTGSSDVNAIAKSFGTITNCYYLNGSDSKATQVNSEQLRNGYVLSKLGSAWAQTLGEDTIPTLYDESKVGSANYIYSGTDGWTCDNFQITDGTALPIGLDFLAKKLTNSRTFSEGYYTVCLPYDLSVPMNTTYSEFTNVDDAHTTVNFTTGSDNVLSAYQPYILKVTDKSTNLSGENIMVKVQPAATSSTTAFVGTVKGLTSEEAANAGAYILQSDNYWHLVKTGNANATIPAYRSYLVLPSTSAAKSYRFAVDGISTGISSVNAENSISSSAVYDLQGRKIADNYEDVKNTLPTGIYLVNGKKFVKK